MAKHHDWKPKFLKYLSEGLAVSHAAAACAVTRQAAYKARTTDPEFGQAYEAAMLAQAEALETEARRRAMEGVKKIITHKGEILTVPVDAKGNVVPKESPDFVGMIPLVEHQYSDRLMEVLLKGRNPEVFGDKVKVQNDVHLRTVADGQAAADEILTRIRGQLGVKSN